MRIDIRAGGLGDVTAVLEFWRKAAEGTDRHDDREKVVALIERDPGALLIAELAGGNRETGHQPAREPGRAIGRESGHEIGGEMTREMAGTVIAGWDGWRAHLYRLAVAEEHRRKGVGRALIAAAEERFRGFGAFRADAMVLTDNLLAHHAWSAAGYAPQPEWARWVKPMPPH